MTGHPIPEDRPDLLAEVARLTAELNSAQAELTLLREAVDRATTRRQMDRRRIADALARRYTQAPSVDELSEESQGYWFADADLVLAALREPTHVDQVGAT